MENYKLRIKIGTNEFDAEGPKDLVMAQFEDFKELVTLQFSQKEHPETPNPIQNNISHSQEHVEKKEIFDKQQHLDIIFAEDIKKRIVSLKIQPPKGKDHMNDAILLTLLGYKLLRNEDQVLATQLKASLRQSGTLIERLERKTAKGLKEGLILKNGLKKGCSYRLTNKGITIAENLISDILKQVT